ncbi:MAG: c-type cytochrome [Gallionellaceae bacterium]|nr:c-type cytochrome [Gallionellaceae bacterium]
MTVKCIASMAALALLMSVITSAVAAEKVQGDPAKAESIVASACASCHGLDGNSPVPGFPKLAGQSPVYLLRELKEFKLEHRKSEAMTPFIANLSEEDQANLALYFAAQKPTPGVVTKPELVAAGKKIYLEGNSDSGVPSCDGCHSESGAGSDRFPRVAGQDVEYTLAQIKLYAQHVRKYGIKAMRIVAERLTDLEAEAVAQYLASLK